MRFERWLARVGAVLSVFAMQAEALSTDKRDIKNNSMIVYNALPKSVSSFDEMFSEAVVYGRLRSNMFYWDWENPSAVTEDNFSWGVGGSLVYSTGYLEGLGATAGMYTTHTIATDNTVTVDGLIYDTGASGKDTYSRATGSGSHIDVLALSYLEYKVSQSSIKIGRQIFESAMLRSNDTKMIPNTFEGCALESHERKETKLRLAYFTRQKLRDHRDFHSIIAYEGYQADGGYTQNDDGAAHRGLSVSNIQAASKDVEPEMFVATIQDRSIQGLKLNLDGMYIDGFVSSAVAEANYRIKLEDGWSLTPGVRYFHQMDEGAGRIGGAALSGAFGLDKTASSQELASYKDPDSVEGGAWMARVKLSKGAGQLTAGYSSVLDKADLIAPWRGFPTAGYTRSMAQYNWEANTRSWMIQSVYDFGMSGIIEGLRGAIDYAYMDYDQTKIDAKTIYRTDRDIIHLDAFKTFDSVKNVELKFRAAMVNSEKSPHLDEDYTSYNEYRFEVNYLF